MLYVETTDNQQEPQTQQLQKDQLITGASLPLILFSPSLPNGANEEELRLYLR